MDYVFSEKVTNVKPSAIRELFKLMAGKNIIPLSGGNPAKEAFPMEEIEKIAEKILKEEPVSVLQYGVSEGCEQLRDMIGNYMRTKYKVGGDNDSVLITSGAMQGIDVACKIFGNEGDTLICDDPCFVGSISSFKVNNLNVVGVEMDDRGMRPDLLEEAIKNNKNVKLLYLIPNFQNPTGITISLERRKELYEIAKKYNVIIIEDNPYGELRFKGEHIPAIKTFDTEGIVCYIGSFSKVVAPGLRTGYMIANEKIIERGTLLKQFSDAHTNVLAQRICSEYYEKYNIEEHINFVRQLYAKKCSLMIEEMKKNFPPEITYNEPDGGMFIWCRIAAENIDVDELVDLLIEKYHVAIITGSCFAIDSSKKVYTFRLNFTVPTQEQIKEGIAGVGSALKELMARAR